MKIGIISDSFRLNLRDGLKKAAQLGANGVQIYAVQGEMAPENLNAPHVWRTLCWKPFSDSKNSRKNIPAELRL